MAHPEGSTHDYAMRIKHLLILTLVRSNRDDFKASRGDVLGDNICLRGGCISVLKES